MSSKEDKLAKLRKRKRELKDEILRLEEEIANDNEVVVNWSKLQELINDFDNWSRYPHTLDDREEGYNLCGPDGSECCSGVCCCYPELYYFETLDKDFDNRIIMCQVCWDNGHFKLEDFVDPQEYNDTHTFRLDGRNLAPPRGEMNSIAKEWDDLASKTTPEKIERRFQRELAEGKEVDPSWFY